MTAAPPPTDALPRLLKRLYRFRERRPWGLERLLTRRRKAALLAEFTRLWPGGYIETASGDLAFLPAPLDRQGERVLFYGWSAPRAVFAFVPPGGTVIDVGANLGEWSVPLSKAVGPSGRVLAVEPNPAVAAALSATLRINNLTQARVLRVALSERDGDGMLQVDPAHSGLSHLSDDAGMAVSLRRLDTIVAEAAPARLDLVKIDVEGHERAVLAGAGDTLRRFGPALVFESGHETLADRAAIAAQFAKHAYDIVAVLHDYGALACSSTDYTAAGGPCAGSEARNILALSRVAP